MLPDPIYASNAANGDGIFMYESSLIASVSSIIIIDVIDQNMGDI